MLNSGNMDKGSDSLGSNAGKITSFVFLVLASPPPCFSVDRCRHHEVVLGHDYLFPHGKMMKNLRTTTSSCGDT